jgi:hypothetical protein
MELSFRFMQPEDRAEVDRLWREETPWGELGDHTSDWYNANPHEGSFIVIAADEAGQPVAVFPFMAAGVSIHGRRYRAARPIAPIVSKPYRTFKSKNPAHHPILGMYGFAEKIAKERGDGLFYMLPNPGWTRLLKMFPGLTYGKFPLWSLPLPLAQPFDIPGYTVTNFQPGDTRVDALWERSAEVHPCLTVRDAQTLAWKSSFGRTHTLCVERGGELVGLVVSMFRDGQWLVTDMLTKDLEDSLVATVKAVSNFANVQRQNWQHKFPLRKVAILAVAGMLPVLQQLAFQRDDYDFLFMVQPLRPDILKSEVAVENWYVSAND